LIPLLKQGLLETSSLVIDAKSGTTGAGRKESEKLLFSEVDGDCLPYRVGKHQHLPEIVQCIKDLTGVTVDPHFTTHLLPTRRGITSGIYARFAPRYADLPKAELLALVERAYGDAYEKYPLIQFHSIHEKEMPSILSLRKVVGTPQTHLGFTVEKDKLYLFSSLDNLLKGAASQAVENWNLSHDLPAETGLMAEEGYL
jgi:N-acetyl-gamma-glutamyl-phosphate reductase